MRKKIIIIEDDVAVGDAMGLVFDPRVFDITLFANGNIVLKNEYELPDLFIIDKQLAGVDGLDICRHLKAQSNTSHIPVIILSASPNIVALARAAGADWAMGKPFSLAVLRQKVNELIDPGYAQDRGAEQQIV